MRERATFVRPQRWRGLDEAAAKGWTKSRPRNAGKSMLGRILDVPLACVLGENAPPSPRPQGGAAHKVARPTRWRGLDEAAAKAWTKSSPTKSGKSMLGRILLVPLSCAHIESAPPAREAAMKARRMGCSTGRQRMLGRTFSRQSSIQSMMTLFRRCPGS